MKTPNLRTGKGSNEGRERKPLGIRQKSEKRTL